MAAVITGPDPNSSARHATTDGFVHGRRVMADGCRLGCWVSPGVLGAKGCRTAEPPGFMSAGLPVDRHRLELVLSVKDRPSLAGCEGSSGPCGGGIHCPCF